MMNPNEIQTHYSDSNALDSSYGSFATFAIPAFLLTDYLPLRISKMDRKLKNIQEH